MRARRDVVRRLEATQGRRHELAYLGRHLDLFAARSCDGDRSRRALLQQQFRRLDHGMRVEPLSHEAIVHDVAQ